MKFGLSHRDFAKDVCLKDWVGAGPVLSHPPQDANFYPCVLKRTETEIKQATLLALFRNELKRCEVYIKLELCYNLSWCRLTYFQWHNGPMPICVSWLQQKILKPIGKTHLIFKSSRQEQQRLWEDACIFYYNVERAVLMCINLNLYSMECNCNLNLIHISSCFNIRCYGFCNTGGESAWYIATCARGVK